MRSPGASHGENTSNEPGRLPRSATEASRIGVSHRSNARAPRASTRETAPASGEQNMKRVSGSLIMSASIASSTDTGLRRHAYGWAVA